MTALLLLACMSVTVGPGWSEPVLVTDSANTERWDQFLHLDSNGRFHLIWAGFNDEDRIGYKMFDLEGFTIYPETMISRDVHSLFLSSVETGDSIYAFWRESNPVYTAARSLSDGSEVLPATHLFTNYTYRAQIISSPDSLGRLHVLYNGNEGGSCPLHYAVWSPSPDSGFTTEYEWIIKGVDDSGQILVDGNRVHIVALDSLVHDYVYLQYDIEGNTVVPLTDFTTPDDIIDCSGYPPLQVDSFGDLLILESAYINGVEAIYLWKLDGANGVAVIDQYPLVLPELPEMDTLNGLVVEPALIQNQFYLCWRGYFAENKIFYLIFDSDGNIIHDWQLAYDYSDEDPEDIQNIDGVTDDQGNLYIIFAQVETEPQVDYFPTFGWFDYGTLGIEDSTSEASFKVEFTISQNPVTGSITVQTADSAPLQLKVLDLVGREVSVIHVSDGVGTWSGISFSGERLPAGIYSIIEQSGFIQNITLLGE